MADRYWVGGTGTWDGTNTTNWSATSGGAGGASVPTAVDNVFFDSLSSGGSYTVTFSSSVPTNLQDMNIGAPASGTLNLSSSGSIINVYGNWTSTSTNVTWTGPTLNLNFLSPTAGSVTVTTGGLQFAVTNIFAGTSSYAGTVVFADDFTAAYTTTKFDHTYGNIDISAGVTITTGIWASASAAVTRVIAFGTSGQIVLTGNNTTILNYSTSVTGFSYTGTCRFVCNYSGATGTRNINCSGFNSIAFAAVAPLIYVTAGTDTVAWNTGGYGGIDFTGFSGTLANGSAAVLIYGNLILSPTMTMAVGTLRQIQLRPQNAANLYILDSGGINVPYTIYIFGPNVTSNLYQLRNNLNLTNGGQFIQGGGALDLNNYTLTCLLWSFGGGSGKGIDFGTTGGIVITGGNASVIAGTILSNARWSGKGNIILSNAAATGTRTITLGTTLWSSNIAQALPSLNVLDGTDAISITGYYSDITFGNSFTGNLNLGARTMSGNLSIGTGMTLVGGGSATTFVPQSGNTKTVTTNGKTITFPITISGPGNAVLADNFTSNTTITMNGGNTTASANVTVASVTISGASAGNIILGNGTWTVLNTGTAWNDTSTNFGYVAGSSTLNFPTDSATRTLKFSNSANLYNLTLSGNTANSVTSVTGNVTMNTINANYTGPFTLSLGSGNTYRVAHWNVTGNVTTSPTLNSTTVGSAHNLIWTGTGAVRTVDYLNIQDSNASPSTLTWYAGGNSVNQGNNTGWIWLDPPPPPPPGTAPNFFLLF